MGDEVEKEDVVFYMTTISSNLEVKKKQQKIEMILGSKKATHNVIQKDVSVSPEMLAEMRMLVDDKKACPPQLYSPKYGYLGAYEAFENACESGQLVEFLRKE